AHPEVLNLFYQVFDKGILSDGEGREVDFKNTVVFLTSNLATDVIAELCKDPELTSVDTVMEALRPVLSNYLKPALLARMTVAPYYPLGSHALEEITRLKLDKIARRLLTSHKLTLNYSDAAVKQIAARCSDVETGARNVDYILNMTVLPELSKEILTGMSGG